MQHLGLAKCISVIRDGLARFAIALACIIAFAVSPSLAQVQGPTQFQTAQADVSRLRAFEQLRPAPSQSQTDRSNLARIDWDRARQDRMEQSIAYRALMAQQVTNARQIRFYAPLSERSQARLRTVHLPVLLPQLGSNLTTRDGGEPGIMLTTRAHFYDASFFMSGVNIHVGGNARINHRLDDPQFRARLRADETASGVRISRDEGGFTASFSRYGAAYTVSVECASRSDRRCRNSELLENMVERLVVAGGNPEE